MLSGAIRVSPIIFVDVLLKGIILLRAVVNFVEPAIAWCLSTDDAGEQQPEPQGGHHADEPDDAAAGGVRAYYRQLPASAPPPPANPAW